MLKVLIVEDDVFLARSLADNLRAYGCEIAGIASSVNEAIGMLETARPELALIDIELQGKKNGIDLAEHINRTRRIPFIYLTDFYGSESRHFRRATDSRPANFLPKGMYLPKQLWHFVALGMDHFAADQRLFAEGFGISFVLQGNLFVKKKGVYKRVFAGDIQHIEVADAYCKIYTAEGIYAIKTNLGQLVRNLGNAHLVRCHQSFAVNVKFISEYQPSVARLVLQSGKSLSLGRTYKAEVLKRLNLQG